MQKMLSDFERNGLALTADKRAQLAELLKKVLRDVRSVAWLLIIHFYEEYCFDENLYYSPLTALCTDQ